MTPLRLLPFTLFLAACGGGEAGVSTPSVVLAMSSVSGDDQTAAVTQVLPLPLGVLVTGDGAPLAGQVVIFAPTAGSGRVTPGVDTTGADGIASGVWILGTTAGPRSVKVTAIGIGGTPLFFSATAIPGPAATFLATNGQGQVQQVNAPFPSQLGIRLLDAFGNGLSGVAVDWEVVNGGAQLGAPSSVTAADGRSAMSVTAGSATGPATVRANVLVLPDTVRFELVVTPIPVIVTVASNFFQPVSTTIPAGGAVKWVWSNGTHDVTSTGGPTSFGMSPIQGAGSIFGPLVFPVSGVYTYECTLHPGMTGTITVQ